eukprot:CAMPEP_0197622970 /NCGR_PEP_ID=MMETSP1338-20131121/3071_1 /TAXON_ID=43686 ORGANISM="Pelagodinium beii, Strain RCC1491" /NCGR_SAMPLE_ID=MMETSP1338 /ASSEMBLY_ACC=CAM_ASM_000754 /LENGTH=317 /DNA_ID=CAMNT_0043192781 /DNA_START=145 /DNA_END=1095 /DNA_ORIENTATION=+
MTGPENRSFAPKFYTGLVTVETSARGHILLQGHIHRGRSSPAVELLKSMNDMKSAPNATSRRQRGAVAALQARSERVNCTSLAEPCLPYQSFTENQLAATQKSLPSTNGSKTGTVASQRPDNGTLIEALEWLPLELHIDNISMEELIAKSQVDHSRNSALAGIIMGLRSSMAKSCGLDENRVLMASVYGQFVRQVVSSSLMEKTDPSLEPVYGIKKGARLDSGDAPYADKLSEEVVISFYVHAGQDDMKLIFDTLKGALQDKSGNLMTGSFKKVMQNARIAVGHEENNALLNPPMDQLSTMALPFAVSAFCTGILIW